MCGPHPAIYQFALSLSSLLDWVATPQDDAMFRFFRITEVLAFADSVASDYDRLVRSTVLRDDSPQKRQQKFEKLSQKVDAYSREQKLNFYKKSKMLYAIKEGLEKNGVAESEITAFLNNLLAKGLRKI
jgi:hypothetical protein